MVSEKDIEEIAIKFTKGERPKGSQQIFVRRCRSLFGLDCHLITIVWSSLETSGILQSMPQKKPVHLMMALHFMKSYGIQTQLASMFGIDEKTYRKWVWLYINAIRKLSRFYVSENYDYYYIS